MRTRILLFLAFLSVAVPAVAQRPVEYTLHVDSAGSSILDVSMTIHGAAETFQLAMATHAEYDDQYWRYVSGLRGMSANGSVTITRQDSSLWRVQVTGRREEAVTIRYRIHLLASISGQQSSWKAHLGRTGGLIGGPHSFMYVVGGERSPARITLELPKGWKVATGLDSLGSSRSLSARTIETLIDSPIMVGIFRSWGFNVQNVHHDVAFLGVRDGVAFDSAMLVSNLEKLTRETVRMFGQMPYRRFQFLFEDGANGGLEHVNSVSIGMLSRNLATDPNAYLAQTAHEYFHIWNEVDIRPAAWVGIRHVTPPATGELWFSEGVTLYYADLLMRRAGLPTQDSTRLAHLQRMMSTYLNNPSQGEVSPVRTSEAYNLTAVLGDYTPSIFTQGEMLGDMLDLLIRNGSEGRRSLDDVMRSLSIRFNPTRGILQADLERAVGTACSCDAHAFFAKYVSAAAPLDFDSGLGVIGMRAITTWAPARTANNEPAPDARLTTISGADSLSPRLLMFFPTTVWARAGLHTGDVLVSWNGTRLTSAGARTAISQLHIGDSVRVVVRRTAIETFTTTVVVPGYDRPIVRIEARPGATDAQKKLRAAWLAGN